MSKIHDMKNISRRGLLLMIFIPTLVLNVVYLVLGQFIKMPNLLLFCIIATFTMMPIEIGIIIHASKRETGEYSLASAFVGQEEMALWSRIVRTAFTAIWSKSAWRVTSQNAG